jgi:heme O synthase-like polyprenyltransferase
LAIFGCELLTISTMGLISSTTSVMVSSGAATWMVNPMEPDLSAVMERESIRDQVARRLPDHDEAIEAFIQKREPEFNK